MTSNTICSRGTAGRVTTAGCHWDSLLGPRLHSVLISMIRSRGGARHLGPLWAVMRFLSGRRLEGETVVQISSEIITVFQLLRTRLRNVLNAQKNGSVHWGCVVNDE